MSLDFLNIQIPIKEFWNFYFLVVWLRFSWYKQIFYWKKYLYYIIWRKRMLRVLPTTCLIINRICHHLYYARIPIVLRCYFSFSNKFTRERAGSIFWLWSTIFIWSLDQFKRVGRPPSQFLIIYKHTSLFANIAIVTSK